jgi:atypical dual specificity phosphatase
MARLNYHRLGDSLLAGAMPFRADHVEALHGEGVTAVVNLCQEREYWDGERQLVLDAYAAHGITEHHLPVIDGSTVPPEILHQAVEIARANTVYVHCRGGRERSATVAIAVISTLEGLEIDHAVEQAKSRRPIFQPLPWQVSGLHSWQAELRDPQRNSGGNAGSQAGMAQADSK